MNHLIISQYWASLNPLSEDEQKENHGTFEKNSSDQETTKIEIRREKNEE